MGSGALPSIVSFVAQAAPVFASVSRSRVHAHYCAWNKLAKRELARRQRRHRHVVFAAKHSVASCTGVDALAVPYHFCLKNHSYKRSRVTIASR